MLNVVEAFSGIGSQAKALKKLGIDYKVVNILEWDISAFVAYDFIHNGAPDITPYKNLTKKELLDKLIPLNLSIDGKNPVKRNSLNMWKVESLQVIWAAYNRTRNLGDIQKVDHLTFPSDIDVLTYSFPCQDLSIGGAWHNNHSGIDRDANNRSGLLWEVERILESLHDNDKDLPRFLLMENVSNILSKRHASNFNDWKNQLERLGYFNKVYTLDASNFGSPQRRVRTFMVSVLLPNKDVQTLVEQYFKDNDLEETSKNNHRKPKKLERFLRMDYSNPIYKEEANISNPNDTPSRRKIYEGNDILNKPTGFNEYLGTLTTKQDRHPNAGILEFPEHREGGSPYRNLTPRECFLLMGFDEADFNRVLKYNPQIQVNKKLYSRERLERLAGNSIVVDVLVKIFEQINELKSIIYR
ncbi:DNA (cytosine-5-)-methyltransferase [Veillonella infantium]|uniref:Cytosine-specific methyltransferase n=1 Tax=Veillonella infantium TaxID=1911679 RepID=A0ABX5C996_9FIRM|nr:DNA (cytosine-5-)-methyltransferase [Veillonella infantium]PQL58832.1 DNA (cytosine-5-)-methyltransferase [Veillonella infantium]